MFEAFVALVKIAGVSVPVKFYFKTRDARNDFVHAHPGVAIAKRGKPERVTYGAFIGTICDCWAHFHEEVTL